MQYSAPKTSHCLPSLLIEGLFLEKSCFVLNFLEKEDNLKMFVKYSSYWLESNFKKKLLKLAPHFMYSILLLGDFLES